MSELEYSSDYAGWLSGAGIAPPTTPVGIRGTIKAILAALGGSGVTPATVAVASNAGTVPATGAQVVNFTNSSAATMAITMSTTGATNGQIKYVRVYDFSAVAETIGWTNTENSGVSVPTTSAGSTTLPLTVGFMFNGATSKWRCILSC